jgi:hypothetical protein
VARDYLGLFDTPPNRQEIRFGVAIVGLLFAAVMVILPIRNIQLGSVDAFVPTINAVMFAGELIIGTLLYAQAAVFRSRALTILASGYVFAALLLVPHALSFPGAFSDNGLLGARVIRPRGSQSFGAWRFQLRSSSMPGSSGRIHRFSQTRSGLHRWSAWASSLQSLSRPW